MPVQGTEAGQPQANATEGRLKGVPFQGTEAGQPQANETEERLKGVPFQGTEAGQPQANATEGRLKGVPVQGTEAGQPQANATEFDVKILPLENTIQNYAWGSKVYIPELLGEPTPAAEPQAEMWMGAHPKAPSMVDGRELPEIIADDPDGILGRRVAARYNGKLPFLFKLLAAGTPLSIQAHPNLEQAKDGFARDNAAGIPLDAPNRNYKDPNHKPEIICALSEFWGLNGFREIPEILAVLTAAELPTITPELDGFRANATTAGLRRFFREMMELPTARKTALIADLLAWADGNPDAVESRWIRRGKEVFGHDIGLLSILLLNLVQLQPGEAMYCAAGDLHAYLDGFGVELMANSDNVLRGGCTVKHVDVPELMRVLTFDDRPATILQPDADGVYRTPAPEFQLSVAAVAGEQEMQAETVEILLCVDGKVDVEGEGGPLPLTPGHSVLVPAGTPFKLIGNGKLYKAGVGGN